MSINSTSFSTKSHCNLSAQFHISDLHWIFLYFNDSTVTTIGCRCLIYCHSRVLLMFARLNLNYYPLYIISIPSILQLFPSNRQHSIFLCTVWCELMMMLTEVTEGLTAGEEVFLWFLFLMSVSFELCFQVLLWESRRGRRRRGAEKARFRAERVWGVTDVWRIALFALHGWFFWVL